MGFGCKYHLYLGLIHKVVTTPGLEYKSLHLLVTDGESSLEGGRGKGDGKKTNQRLLGDEEK